MTIDDFKTNVCVVEIESSSYCNRKCSYCINYYIDRLSKNDIMPYEVYKKIIDELSDIEYDRMVTFHRYNEPFFDRNTMILERIKYAREKLPHATLSTSSNSDFLDAEYVQNIRSSGLDLLYCQCQIENYSLLSLDEIKDRIVHINKRIGNFKGKFIYDDNKCVFITVNSGFKSLTIQAKNFNRVGVDRGGIVKNVNTQGLKGVCYNPLVCFPIDYNGKVMMCLNTVSYYDEHTDFIIGDCNTNSIIEIYRSQNAMERRRKLLHGYRFPLCSECARNYEEYIKRYNLIT